MRRSTAANYESADTPSSRYSSQAVYSVIRQAGKAPPPRPIHQLRGLGAAPPVVRTFERQRSRPCCRQHQRSSRHPTLPLSALCPGRSRGRASTGVRDRGPPNSVLGAALPNACTPERNGQPADQGLWSCGRSEALVAVGWRTSVGGLRVHGEVVVCHSGAAGVARYQRCPLGEST